MKHSPTVTAFCLACALLGPAAVHAHPLFSPLFKPLPLAALLAPPELPASVLPLGSKPGQPPWALGAGPLWTLDSSLQLTDWSHVFDVAALGSFDVPLRSDPAERTNILLSAQAVDNVTIAPGAEFSFNAQVGERTPERGYQDGFMFDNGRLVRGTGGGICLVATGLYNAALQAGLEITERHPHSGVVSYAAPGCDAGIVYGLEDLKFRNTTAKPLVIRSQPAADHVSVQLFGPALPPDCRVIVKPISLTPISYAVITKPDPTLLPGEAVVDQKPRSGFEVVLGRFWTDHGRVVRREIVTHERRAPRNKIMRVAAPPMVVPDPLTPAPALLDLTTPPAAAPLGVPPTDAEPGD